MIDIENDFYVKSEEKKIEGTSAKYFVYDVYYYSEEKNDHLLVGTVYTQEGIERIKQAYIDSQE